MARPTPLSGFPEYLPDARQAELAVIDVLRETFELHGFVNVETRSVETLEQLLQKGDIDNEVYVLRRLHAAGDEPDTGVGLHYDLTVPLARYVVEHAGKLEFPFRRYQIQRAWRGERPQEGRFREFTQADIDIVGKDELAFHFDVEIAAVMAEALARLPVPPLRLEINNRRLVEGFYRGVGIDDPYAVMRAVDKLDKVPADVVESSLVDDVGLDAEQAAQCLRLATIRTTDESFVDEVRSLGVRDELLDTGIDQLAAVLAGCRPFAGPRFTVEADLRITRGLDYYTGTVFETTMSGFEQIGSICSGGRYDALATDGKSTYPGVGISFGVSRALHPLITRGLLSSDRMVPSAVLVALVTEDERARSTAIANRLRARGIPTEVAANATKYGRQIRYAERRGIPYVWFPGTDLDDAVRDIRSGDQEPADADSWSPPDADLRPRIVVKEQQ